MKKTRITIFAFFATIMLAGCVNNQDRQLQQQNDLLNQQNTFLQEQVNPQDVNTDNPPGYVVGNSNNTTPTVYTKTIPFDAVDKP